MAVIVLAGFGCQKGPISTTPPPQPPINGVPPSPIETDKVKVAQPIPGDLVSSPVKVKGEARGNWYFEASFPIQVLDANGKEIGIGIAQAQGEWMTTEFVPFDVDITFTVPTTSTGSIVLVKDNPSGLPEFDDQVVVPVKFK